MNNSFQFSSVHIWCLRIFIFLGFNHFCIDLAKSQKFNENLLNLTTQTAYNSTIKINGSINTNQINSSSPLFTNQSSNNNQLVTKNNFNLRTDSIDCEEGYDCVPYFLCKDNVIVKDGTGIINIRTSGDSEGCTDSMELCCAVNNLTANPIINTTPPTSPERCGYRNKNGIVVKIIGDEDNEAQFAEFPWMIAVLRKENTINGELVIYQCGGSLINALVVMTAAHCVSGLPAYSLRIRAGEWDTKTILEPLPYQDREVTQVIIHENYDKKILKNDIALLLLESPLSTIVENVKPICLPSNDFKLTNYEKCYATGWGKDKFGDQGKHQVILKKIDLPPVPRPECQNLLRTTRLGKYFELDESFICAGGVQGRDTCKGDGGSPLFCQIYGANNRYHQVGIVSWGIGCGTNNIPGVYTNVTKYRDWVDQIMISNNLNELSYVAMP